MSLSQVAKTQDWIKRTLPENSYSPEYQELKFLIHRRLLDRINLEALSSIVGDRARAEVIILRAAELPEQRQSTEFCAIDFKSTGAGKWIKLQCGSRKGIFGSRHSKKPEGMRKVEGR